MSPAPRPGAVPGAPTAPGAAAQVRVRIPALLQVLAGAASEVQVDVKGPVTQRAVLDGLEGLYPVLAGTVRDRSTARRRPFIRFFVGSSDLSNAPPDDPLPPAVERGAEPFVVVGAMAGG